MPNQSFKCWTGVLRCDSPCHKSGDPEKPDWYYDDAKTVAEYKLAARKDGWRFERNGRVICSDCTKRDNGEGWV